MSFTFKGDAEWDNPGIVTVKYTEDDYDAFLGENARSIDLTFIDIYDAYRIACQKNLQDPCIGESIDDIDFADFDACIADMIIQIAVFEQVLFG